jgi:hypothetical protein
LTRTASRARWELLEAQQVTDLFGSTEWRPILDGRQSGALDAERTRDELTNLMRWRLEKTLGYGFPHTLRLTNVNGVPLR